MNTYDIYATNVKKGLTNELKIVQIFSQIAVLLQVCARNLLMTWNSAAIAL